LRKINHQSFFFLLATKRLDLYIVVCQYNNTKMQEEIIDGGDLRHGSPGRSTSPNSRRRNSPSPIRVSTGAVFKGAGMFMSHFKMNLPFINIPVFH
jgi:hypothetical protein